MNQPLWRAAAFAAFLTAFLAAGRAWGQASPELDRVLADWQHRRERVRSVEYTVVGEGVIPKGRFNGNAPDERPPDAQGNFPPQDITYEKRINVLYDFENNRYRIESSDQGFYGNKGQMYPRGGTSVFNGKDFKSLSPRDANANTVLPPPPADQPRPDVTIITGSKYDSGATRADTWPIDAAHGSIPTDYPAADPEQIRAVPDRSIFYVHGRGKQADRDCLILRTKALNDSSGAFQEFWIDPDRESAIVKRVNYVEGRVWDTLDIDYHQTPDGWLPESWIYTFYVRGTGPGELKTHTQDRMRVQAVSINPAHDAKDFDIELKPGMIVQKYQMGADGRTNESAVKLFRVGENGELVELIKGPEPRGGLLWIYLLFFILPVAGVVAAWLLRRPAARAFRAWRGHRAAGG